MNPNVYVTSNDMQRHRVRVIAREFTHEIAMMSGRCIDIGSGPGDIFVDIILPNLNQKTSFVCSDISEQMLDYGRAKYKNHQRLSFLNLNIETTDLSKDLIEQFDHATSFHCLHWCRDIRQALENIFSLLRPGGTVLLTFPAQSTIFDTYKVLAAMPRYQPYIKDVDSYIPPLHLVHQPREILESLLRTVGFEVQHCSMRAIRYIYDTSRDLENFLLSVNPFVQRMPADIRETYIEDLVQRITRSKITSNQNNNDVDESSRLFKYTSFVVYLRKPETTCK